MSKRHKHRRYCEVEHMRYGFITEEELLILIAVILIFSNRNNYYYDYGYDARIQYRSNEKVKDKASYNEEQHIYDIVEEKLEELQDIDSGLQSCTMDIREEEWGNLVEDEINNFEENLQSTQELAEESPVIDYTKVKVCNTTIIQCCSNENIEENISLEPVVSEIPVIISQPKLQILVEALISFNEPVFKIKELDKKVFLDSCKLVTGSDKLFVNGFIEENVEYITAEGANLTEINGRIKKATFNIPFQCSTKIDFSFQPHFACSSSGNKLETINTSLNNTNLNEKSYEYFEMLNDKVFAEIDSSKIIETSVQDEIELLENTIDDAYTFNKIRKNIIVHLKLNLVQKQNIFMNNLNKDDFSQFPYCDTENIL
jgi:hypothetical protein